MSKYLPGKYDYGWFIIFTVIILLLLLFLLSSRIIVLKQQLSFTYCLGMFLLALSISFVLSLLGYLGLRIFLGGGSAGLLAGMAAMIYFYIKGEGWSGLIGPFVLIELTLAGLGIGLVLQFVLYMIEKYWKS